MNSADAPSELVAAAARMRIGGHRRFKRARSTTKLANQGNILTGPRAAEEYECVGMVRRVRRVRTPDAEDYISCACRKGMNLPEKWDHTEEVNVEADTR